MLIEFFKSILLKINQIYCKTIKLTRITILYLIVDHTLDSRRINLLTLHINCVIHTEIILDMKLIIIHRLKLQKQLLSLYTVTTESQSDDFESLKCETYNKDFSI